VSRRVCFARQVASTARQSGTDGDAGITPERMAERSSRVRRLSPASTRLVSRIQFKVDCIHFNMAVYMGVVDERSRTCEQWRLYTERAIAGYDQPILKGVIASTSLTEVCPPPLNGPIRNKML